MTTSKTREVNPDTVRYHRESLRMTQEELAEKAGLGRKTIQRYESKVERQSPNKTSLPKLCRALNVRPEQLMEPPPAPDVRRLRNRVDLKTDIAGAARTALTFMELHYGLLEEAILDLAPLAFLILAEKSLQARQADLDETIQALEVATSDAYGRHPYMRGAFFDGYDHDWIATERKSLKEREVYEQYIDDERREMSPFVDFLEKELEALGLFQKHPIEFFSNYRTAPDYAIPVDILASALGLDATDEADLRALERIQDGQIDLREVWEKKEQTNEEEYRRWLADQAQAVEQKLKALFPVPKTTFLGRRDGVQGGSKENVATNTSAQSANIDPEDQSWTSR